MQARRVLDALANQNVLWRRVLSLVHQRGILIFSDELDECWIDLVSRTGLNVVGISPDPQKRK